MARIIQTSDRAYARSAELGQGVELGLGLVERSAAVRP